MELSSRETGRFRCYASAVSASGITAYSAMGGASQTAEGEGELGLSLFWYSESCGHLNGKEEEELRNIVAKLQQYLNDHTRVMEDASHSQHTRHNHPQPPRQARCPSFRNLRSIMVTMLVESGTIQDNTSHHELIQTPAADAQQAIVDEIMRQHKDMKREVKEGDPKLRPHLSATGKVELSQLRG